MRVLVLFLLGIALGAAIASLPSPWWFIVALAGYPLGSLAGRYDHALSKTGG